MSKKNIIIVVVVVLVALIVGVLGYKMSHNNQYSVVYLTTGEVYVGKLSTFPSLTLTDGYILQVIKDATDPTKNNFQLQPISQALLGAVRTSSNRKKCHLLRSIIADQHHCAEIGGSGEINSIF